ncbi:hypothetical protein CBS101457_006479 [Exobasidium rhododendri]|nr:hypothetical protein CBS101457_006479 [Exobasidium rhododendri]
MTQEAGPSSIQDAVKAFKDAQEQRVNHWKEYDEAMALYQQQSRSTLASTTSNQTPSNGNLGAAAAAAAAAGESSGHYHAEVVPLTDDVFVKILALVTSGLLDSSHIVRAIETELRTRFNQRLLADLVGHIQDLENAVLRSIVRRDQSIRTANVEGRNIHDSDIQQENLAVQNHRQEIQELMAEINAEMAEMQE